MDEKELETWWASLTVEQKERIAGKIVSKQTDGAVTTCNYPECSRVWNDLPLERRQAIYEHCTDDHGFLLHKWREGFSFSY